MENDNQIPVNPPTEPIQVVPPVTPVVPVTQVAPIIQQPQPEIKTEEHNNGTKTIVTVLVLLFAYPVGLILMWFWAKWPKWVKFLVTLPIILAILGIIAASLIASIDPFKQLGKAQDINSTNTAVEFSSALQTYYNSHQTLPWTANPPCASQPTGLENITSLAPCVNLLIKDGEIKASFLSATTITDNLYVSDNSTQGNINVSTCFLPSVQTTSDKYTRSGLACNAGICYYCSFSQFPAANQVPTASPIPTSTVQPNSSTSAVSQ